MDLKIIQQQAESMQETLVNWRRHIHMHPELSFQEFKTAQFVANTLRDMGLEVETGVGKTGVVARLGEGSPVVGIRADMDALPIDEANDVPYKSQNPGVMHACGHDAHTAMLLGVAKILSELPERPAGEIRFFFQPSEEDQDVEGKSGAMRMVEEGIMNGVDKVIALHVDSAMESRKVAVNDGWASAAVDSFEATIIGKGCHGAYPHTGVDPIYLFAQVVNAIQGVRSRRVNPTKGAVISIGSVHAGAANNVIPNEVQITGTIRSFDDETRDELWKGLEAAMEVARALGGDYRLKFERGYPAMYNAAEVSDVIRGVTTDVFGDDGLIEHEVGMGAEDFSYMLQAAPGAMFNLGAKYDDKDRPHHSPVFNIAEDMLPVGVTVLASAALRLLEDGGA
ncbi:MAG: amidohydrolase [Chloroflexi bacterium]|nr:MAG: peptidase M20 family protein [Chloroflexi bacterium OLB13]MBC6955126.1 amidohydrolase [Chloroflexota bacterium]MBV6438263.1 N-acetyldiaminopimelate deacetylase [Anaerolineae bacterium]MDL1915196.1 amidohydrolase [Anaerolineae bacterium CFX4]MBW7880424.1 amidohydrolase [Anaerolineae bacterium]